MFKKIKSLLLSQRDKLNNGKLFFIYGFLLGLLFPILGTLIECLISGFTINAHNLVSTQINQPLLWIIDLAPFILGAITSFAGKQSDIANEKRKEADFQYRQMLQLKDVADKANQSKSEFLANMSHEIRTPMNGIIGMNYLMKKTGLSDKQTEYHHKIDVSAKNLLRIIDDILDFSKIEAGKLTLENTDMSIQEVISDITDNLNIKAQKKQDLELVAYVDPKIPSVIIGDSVRLRQVILNLADNAVKFTEKGEVKISVTQLTHLPYGVILQFQVSDSGIGISKEQIKLLFNPFQQADLSTTRKFGGTGLGLVICKRIVEMMDGELEVDSAPGKGSVFSFNAFFSLQETKTEQEKEHTISMNGKRVLLVDDSESARMILDEMLTSLGFHVFVAKDAFEAIEIYQKEHTDQNAFSLLVVDWKMPGMDGLKLVEELKSKDGAKVPSVLMVTAYGLESIKSAAKDNLINGVLLKPVNHSSLYDSINQIIQMNEKSVVKVVQSDNNDLAFFKEKLEGKKILLTDDNDINLELGLELLKEVGISADTARDGIEAIQKVKENYYDAVLMDIQMPRMDGLTATRAIRADERYKDLPIIAMTAHAMKGEYEKSILAGMNDHINKPIDPFILFTSMIKNILGESVVKNTSAEKKIIVENTLKIKGLNTEAGLYRVANNIDSYEKLLQTFASKQANVSVELGKILQKNELPLLDSFLHTITGILGSIGAEELYGQVRNLYHEVKKDTEDGILDISSIFAEKSSSLTKEIEGLISEIQIHLNEGKKNKSLKEISEEDFNEKIKAIILLVKDNDQEAITNIDDLFSNYSLSKEQHFKIEQAKKFLDDFEFESALKHLTNE